MQVNSVQIKQCLVHIIGIGGIGMSGMALMMQHQGYKVQGSDKSSSDNIDRLKAADIKVFCEHNAQNLKGIGCIVISSAIKDDNVELVAARTMDLPVLSRAEMLAMITDQKDVIAISGSHGKTTTTALTATLLKSAGLKPSALLGGVLKAELTNAYTGEGKYLVAEIDESDATILSISAEIAVVTNIDPEHLDFYGNIDNLIGAFQQFISKANKAVLCVDNAVLRSISGNLPHVMTYGLSEGAQVTAVNIRLNGFSSVFDAVINLPDGQKLIKNVEVPAPGIHNVSNALAAVSVGTILGLPDSAIINGFRDFRGTARRFDLCGRYRGAMVIDDYAHHPDEVQAVLKCAAQVAHSQQGRLFAVFEPHRYSRLKALYEQFATCFALADRLYITPIYTAGETPAHPDHLDLVRTIELANSEVSYVDSLKTLMSKITNTVTPQDIIIFMGAGNSTYWAHNLANQL